MLIKWDFPEAWPTAFQDLLSIINSTADLQVQKLYLRFIVQVLTIMDEDLVERYEGQDHLHNERASKVKDGIRERAITDICNLLQQLLTNFQVFDADTVNEALEVAAQLIDWNNLEAFEQIILTARGFLVGSIQEPEKF